MEVSTIAKEELQINEEIRDKEVRLIDENGNQQGVVHSDVALRMAEEAGLDLVKIAPQATPPVCKIMDYGNDASWGPRFDPSVKYVTPLSVDPTSSKYGIPDTWESHLNLSDLYKTGVANITNIAFSKSYKDLSTRVSFTNNWKIGV